jgi:Na+-transporting NADH:ubiquinone oxidoreductase subunit B
MKHLLKLFDVVRPLFAKKGIFNWAFTVFDTAEHIFFYPSDCTKSAPHVRDPLDLKRFMGTVLIAMFPCIAASVYFFGPRVLLMILVSYVVGGICEVAFALIRKGEIHEGFFVTGMIFPLVLPPSTPLWVVAIGAAFGIIFGKEVFGGTGRNIFNPALVGRIFVTIAFPQLMTQGWHAPGAWRAALTEGVDVVTTATPMALYKTQQVVTGWQEMLMGNTGGSIGETFHLGIILGGIYLMVTKVSNWRIPTSYVLSVALFGWLGHMASPEKVAPAMFQVLGGGMLFGAMFMATDPVSSPHTRPGKWVFGVLCGFLTVIIRSFSGYVEGVMFSIVIANAFVPLIDHIIVNIKYKEVPA